MPRSLFCLILIQLFLFSFNVWVDYLLPSFYFPSTNVVKYEVNFFKAAYIWVLFLIHFANLCPWTGVFTFKGIIDMLALSLPFNYLFSIYLMWPHSSISLFLPFCCYLNFIRISSRFTVLFSVSFCIVCIVIALSITIYMCDL